MTDKEISDAIYEYINSQNFDYYKLGKVTIIEKVTIGKGDSKFTLASVLIDYTFLEDGEDPDKIYPTPAAVYIDSNRTMVNIDVAFGDTNNSVSLRDMMYEVITNSRNI
jgi:hypothetical protein